MEFFKCTLGTDEERGISQWKTVISTTSEQSLLMQQRLSATYDLPCSFTRCSKLFNYIPFCPTFGSWRRNKPAPYAASLNATHSRLDVSKETSIL